MIDAPRKGQHSVMLFAAQQVGHEEAEDLVSMVCKAWFGRRTCVQACFLTFSDGAQVQLYMDTWCFSTYAVISLLCLSSGSIGSWQDRSAAGALLQGVYRACYVVAVVCIADAGMGKPGMPAMLGHKNQFKQCKVWRCSGEHPLLGIDLEVCLVSDIMFMHRRDVQPLQLLTRLICLVGCVGGAALKDKGWPSYPQQPNRTWLPHEDAC